MLVGRLWVCQESWTRKKDLDLLWYARICRPRDYPQQRPRPGGGLLVSGHSNVWTPHRQVRTGVRRCRREKYPSLAWLKHDVFNTILLFVTYTMTRQVLWNFDVDDILHPCPCPISVLHDLNSQWMAFCTISEGRTIKEFKVSFFFCYQQRARNRE